MINRRVNLHTWRFRSRIERLSKMGSTASSGEDSRIYKKPKNKGNNWIYNGWKSKYNQTQEVKNLTISKHDTAVNCTDSSESSSRANITPKTWVVYFRIWINGICNFKFGDVDLNEKHKEA